MICFSPNPLLVLNPEKSAILFANVENILLTAHEKFLFWAGIHVQCSVSVIDISFHTYKGFHPY